MTNIKSDLEDYIHSIELLTGNIDDFYSYIAKGLAARLLAEVIPDTPVEKNEVIRYKLGKTTAVKNIKGGALRRGWIHDTNGGSAPNVMEQTEYVNSLPVRKAGKEYQITISNNVEYAPYVEYGHRQNVGQWVPTLGPLKDGVRQGAPLKKGWVAGQFMLTNAVKRIEQRLPGLCKKLGDDYMKKIFN